MPERRGITPPALFSLCQPSQREKSPLSPPSLPSPHTPYLLLPPIIPPKERIHTFLGAGRQQRQQQRAREIGKERGTIGGENRRVRVQAYYIYYHPQRDIYSYYRVRYIYTSTGRVAKGRDEANKKRERTRENESKTEHSRDILSYCEIVAITLFRRDLSGS